MMKKPLQFSLTQHFPNYLNLDSIFSNITISILLQSPIWQTMDKVLKVQSSSFIC